MKQVIVTVATIIAVALAAFYVGRETAPIPELRFGDGIYLTGTTAECVIELTGDLRMHGLRLRDVRSEGSVLCIDAGTGSFWPPTLPLAQPEEKQPVYQYHNLHYRPAQLKKKQPS